MLYCKYFCFQKLLAICENGCQETHTQFYYVYVVFFLFAPLLTLMKSCSNDMQKYLDNKQSQFVIYKQLNSLSKHHKTPLVLTF